MKLPWRPAASLPPREFAALRRRAIFECFKWDPQVGDVSALAPYPLVLEADAWAEIAELAEALAAEVARAEIELARRTDLHGRLGLPRAVRRALRRVRDGGLSAGCARLVRFDFHLTHAGWRISEANSDVPGGLNEASGWTGLVAERHPDLALPGDPAARYAEAILAATRRDRNEADRRDANDRLRPSTKDTARLHEAAHSATNPATGPHGTARSAANAADRRDAHAGTGRAHDGATRTSPRIVLVHATAYADDNQVMSYLARELEARGAEVCKLSPAQLEWRAGRAHVRCDWASGAADVVGRFFPAEWLPNLEAQSGWEHFFAGSTTPLSNPATSLVTQTKRFPLVWHELDVDLSTWRALLPETRDPRDVAVDERGAWVLKPALGRVGDGVAIPGVSDAKEWKLLARAARHAPGEWVAQRRFEAVALDTDAGPVFPCIGVYTIDGRAAGAYGRAAKRALIDARSQDVAVLIAPSLRAVDVRSDGARGGDAGVRGAGATTGSQGRFA